MIHKIAYYIGSEAETMEVWIKMVPDSGTQIEVWASEQLAYKSNDKYLGTATWNDSYKYYAFSYEGRELFIT